ncbi:antitermination protein [Candidatus Regiella insecticola]|uniref:Antitermination protein n=1 Tax=Candidatus Regiella insecticola TaxID=138073 RepID=A0A6L2ZNT4_9ENTR|nr:antitermination protein [Candidatus Regiella insecticola]GFN46453.1 antitermination protein [Candidatus Regiella insecticola]
MKLEAAIRYFNPTSQVINDSPRDTSPNTFTRADIATALGMAEAKASFGISAYLGKHDVSHQDRIRAIKQLAQYAKQQAPKHVGKAAGKRMAQCMAILAKFAYAEYGGSAASTYLCSCCAGSGFIDDQADNKNRSKTSLNSPCNNPPRNPLACYIDNREKEKRLCKSCDGKGTVSNRCRCNGTGKVLDRKETKIHGYLVIKICKRCAGRGYKRVPASMAYAAISILLPKLTQSTWSRNWKPFYESLILQCKIEENKAKAVFKQITG